MAYHRLKSDISVLIWLFRSCRPGKEVLKAAVELIAGIVDECYVVLDREGVETAVRAEVLSLLDGLATGRIRADGDGALLSYLLKRYRVRLIPNLLDRELIREREDFVPLEMENEEFLDWLSLRVDVDPDPPGDKDGKKKIGMNSVSISREVKILRTKEFFPGCLAENRKNLTQKELF